MSSTEDNLDDSGDVDDPTEEIPEKEDMEVDDTEEKDTNEVENIEERAGEKTEEAVHDDTEIDDSTNVLNDKSNLPDPEEDTPNKESSSKLFRFPQGRIKSIMKLDPDVGMVNGEAIFLVNKAVEEFIQCLAVESFHVTSSTKKKTIMKEHVMTAIESIDELAFLDGAMED